MLNLINVNQVMETVDRLWLDSERFVLSDEVYDLVAFAIVQVCIRDFDRQKVEQFSNLVIVLASQSVLLIILDKQVTSYGLIPFFPFYELGSLGRQVMLV